MPAPDVIVARDSKAGEHADPVLDPRISLLLQESFRHAKVIGAWAAGVDAVQSVGVDGAAGVIVGDDPQAVFAEIQTAMGAHRVWERFGTTLS